jgi:hypothetical protein
LRIGKTPYQTTKVEEILNINHWSEFRRVSYVAHGGQTRVSKWLSLEKGKKYYIEGEHLNNNSVDHFTTGVEIEQEVLNKKHPNTMKEVQQLSFNTDDVRETHILTIDNPDKGTFRIQFTSPDLKRTVTDELKPTDSTWRIRDRLYWGYFRSRGLNT